MSTAAAAGGGEPAPPPQKRPAAAAAAVNPQEPVVATAIKLYKKEKVLEAAFSNGERHRFSAELLRVLSPSADNCSPAAAAGGGVNRVAAGRRHVGIMRVEPVGRYAVRLHFDDLHNTGIYTWAWLRDLAGHRLSRMRAYLRALRAQGGSRDPRAPPLPPRRAAALKGAGGGQGAAAAGGTRVSSAGGGGGDSSGGKT